MDEIKTFSPGIDYTAKTFAGLEEVLAQELKELGASDVEVIKRGVTFRGDEALLYKANYLLRTAIRILKPIGVFEIKNEQQLYEKVQRIDWSEVFDVEQTFAIDANVFHSELTHEQFVALRTKDAIVDQFREKTGKRPWVDTEKTQIYIDVHISSDVCTISLDASGESLHKRGYRIGADKAPINEVLAAGMILLSGWKKDTDFIDPMCGSGTIPIEAAMIAMNIPPGYYREQFAFMHWKSYDEALWNKVKEAANEKMGEFDHKIIASDRSEKAIGIAKANIKNAGLHKDIDLKVSYFDAIEPPSDKGILIFNPPYGKRLEEKGDLKDLYRGIGDVLKKNYKGYEAWIISPDFEASKFVGLRPSLRIPLYNGPIEARFIKFEMYEGSKRGTESLERRADKYSDGDTEFKTDRTKRFGAREYKNEGDKGEPTKPRRFEEREERGKFDRNKPERSSADRSTKYSKGGEKRSGADKGPARRFDKPDVERSRFNKDAPRKEDNIQVWESDKEEKPYKTTMDKPEEKGPPRRRRRI